MALKGRGNVKKTTKTYPKWLCLNTFYFICALWFEYVRTNNYRTSQKHHSTQQEVISVVSRLKVKKTINIFMDTDAADSYLEITVNEYRAEPSIKMCLHEAPLSLTAHLFWNMKFIIFCLVLFELLEYINVCRVVITKLSIHCYI